MTLPTIQNLIRSAAPVVLTTAMFGLVIAFAAVGVAGVA